MLREEWKFSYETKHIVAATREKVLYHNGRLRFWETKKEEVMAQIKSTGLEIKESLAGGVHSNVARGYDTQVVIDATMQRDLDECAGKIREHRRVVTQYQNWLDVLEPQPQGALLELDYNDYLFFFGKQ